jgi:DNA-binding MurR/RpiR family transcriptional regulator
MTREPDIINRICSIADNLSATDRRIADYLLAHPVEATNCTVRELAAATQTSAATVSRLTRTLGYKSFSELRIAMALSKDAQSNEQEPRYGARSEFVDKLQTILAQKTAELNETAALLNETSFERFAQCCMDAELVFIVGTGRSATFVPNIAARFLQAGIRTTGFTGLETSVAAAETFHAGDTLLILATSGQSEDLSEIVDRAKEKGVSILAIINGADPYIEAAANDVLQIATRDFALTSGPSFSYNSLNFLIELLYLRFTTPEQNSDDQNPAEDGTKKAPKEPLLG